MKPAALLGALLAVAVLSAGPPSHARKARSAPPDLAAAATAPAPPSGVRLIRPGTPKEMLSSAEDSLHKVYEVMRIASVGASERRKIRIVLREDADEARPEGVAAGAEPPGKDGRDAAAAPGPAKAWKATARKRIRFGISGIDGITMEKLLSRVDRFLVEEGPLLLGKAPEGDKAFRETAHRLRRLVLAAAQTGIGPAERDRTLIRDSLLELAKRLEDLERLAPERAPGQAPGQAPQPG